MIRYPVYQPSLKGNEKIYVNECLDTGWISGRGRFVAEFEASFCRFTGIDYSSGVCNGTVAIHLALVSLGIGPGDEVIVPTFTYIASANPIVQVGATPVFVDSARDTWQMSTDDIRSRLTDRTRAIMVVHLYGHPCDMDPILEVARERDIFVIEDCAEALGAVYKGRHVGQFGDVATFSFFGNKTITCGEGGMVATNDATVHDRVVHYKGQGLAKHREYWHDTFGFNYRMTNIQAAIGLAQLEQAPSFLERKKRLASSYLKHLKGLPLSYHLPVGDVVHSYWMFTILVENANLREPLREHLAKAGIETRPTFYPIHTMPMYSSRYIRHRVAEDIAGRGINLPSYPALEDDDVLAISGAVRSFFDGRED